MDALSEVSIISVHLCHALGPLTNNGLEDVLFRSKTSWDIVEVSDRFGAKENICILYNWYANSPEALGQTEDVVWLLGHWVAHHEVLVVPVDNGCESFDAIGVLEVLQLYFSETFFSLKLTVKAAIAPL